MKSGNWCFLLDFICDLTGEEYQSRFNVIFKRWIKQFKSLAELVETLDTYGNTEILIIDKYKFLDELYRLSKQKLIKSQLFK